MKNRDFWILGLVFLLVVGFRLFFVFQSDFFSDDLTYFTIRNIESIKESLKPISFDELSYDGREIIQPSFFYYFLAFFTIFFNDVFIYKIIPLLCISLLVFVVYLIAKEITKDKKAIFLSTFASGFIPILITGTINKISVYSLLLPMMFFMIYCLIKMNKDNIYLVLFVLLSFILPLLHKSAFLFVFSMFFYLLLTSSEGLKISKVKKEAIIFSAFLILLIEFIIFKKAFLVYGLSMLWQNIPKQILANYFGQMTIFEILYGVSIIPLFLGSMGIFYGIHREKREAVFLLSGLMLAVLLLLWLKLLEPIVGFMFLGVALTTISALPLDKIMVYFKRTKFSRLSVYYPYVFILLVIILMIIPSFLEAKNIIKDVPSENELEALNWLKENTFEYSVVLATLKEGNLITGIAKRKNIIDTVFLMAPETTQRLKDVDLVFTTTFEKRAEEAFNKYNVDYIYFSKRAKKEYNLERLSYEDSKFLRKVYENEDVKIFEVK